MMNINVTKQQLKLLSFILNDASSEKALEYMAYGDVMLWELREKVHFTRKGNTNGVSYASRANVSLSKASIQQK